MKNDCERKETREKSNRVIKTQINENENSESINEEEIEGLNANFGSFITTPYERVLSIINEAKSYIMSTKILC